MADGTLYPFGHGLSYTQFTYGDLVVEQTDGAVEFPTTNLANTRTCEHLRRWGPLYEEWGVYMTDERPVGAYYTVRRWHPDTKEIDALFVLHGDEGEPAPLPAAGAAGLLGLPYPEEYGGGGVVATVMSNLGLERFVEGLGLRLARTKVGDRYVVGRMMEKGLNVGGEQSGHIVLSDFSTTGDGLIAALQVLAGIAETGQKASEAAHLFEPLPQLLKNVRFRAGMKPLENQEVATMIEDGKQRLVGKGRLLIRKSGTEPLIRVMAEGEDEALVHSVVGQIVVALEAVA